jgi:hypothetical protein
MRALFLASALLVLGFTTAPSAQDSLAGTWTLSFVTPGGNRDATANFKVDGDKLTGSLVSEMGEVPISGSVKGATFTFNIDVQGPNGNMSIKINGEQTGDALKGTIDFGQGVGDWTGKRAK